MRRSLIIGILACTVLPDAAGACCPASPPGSDFDSADAVFIGEVIRAEYEIPDYRGRWNMIGHTLRVLDSWKGVDADTVVVFGAKSSSSCGVRVIWCSNLFFEEGTRYLVFATHNMAAYKGDHLDFSAFPARECLHTGACSGTRQVEFAGDALLDLPVSISNRTGIDWLRETAPGYAVDLADDLLKERMGEAFFTSYVRLNQCIRRKVEPPVVHLTYRAYVPDKPHVRMLMSVGVTLAESGEPYASYVLAPDRPLGVNGRFFDVGPDSAIALAEAGGLYAGDDTLSATFTFSEEDCRWGWVVKSVRGRVDAGYWGETAFVDPHNGKVLSIREYAARMR